MYVSSFHAAFYLFFFNHPTTTEISTLSLHDALPISRFVAVIQLPRIERLVIAEVDQRYAGDERAGGQIAQLADMVVARLRSEEHTSELQSRRDLVCRLLLEKKQKD